jgi:predicted enzyme involved in methoxymalonyl-ACP biosynthesis
MIATGLPWLPEHPNWTASLKQLDSSGSGQEAWRALCDMAQTRLTSVQTQQLDRRLLRLFSNEPPPGLDTKPIRLAVLASSTIEHLLGPIRVGGARRRLWIRTYTPAYGQYMQEVSQPASGLHEFAPDAVLFALDAASLLAGFDPTMTAAQADQKLQMVCATLAGQWRQLRERHRCQVIQQTLLPVFAPLIGSNEHRLHGSRAFLVERLNHMLRELADAEGVDLLAIDTRAAQDGLAAWYDRALWHRAKQGIHPDAGPLYGDMISRLLATAQGLSSNLAKAARSAKRFSRSSTMFASCRSAASSLPSAPRTTRRTRWSRSNAIPRWC